MQERGLTIKRLLTSNHSIWSMASRFYIIWICTYIYTWTNAQAYMHVHVYVCSTNHKAVSFKWKAPCDQVHFWTFIEHRKYVPKQCNSCANLCYNDVNRCENIKPFFTKDTLYKREEARVTQLLLEMHMCVCIYMYKHTHALIHIHIMLWFCNWKTHSML